MRGGSNGAIIGVKLLRGALRGEVARSFPLFLLGLNLTTMLGRCVGIECLRLCAELESGVDVGSSDKTAMPCTSVALTPSMLRLHKPSLVTGAMPFTCGETD